MTEHEENIALRKEVAELRASMMGWGSAIAAMREEIAELKECNAKLTQHRSNEPVGWMVEYQKTGEGLWTQICDEDVDVDNIIDTARDEETLEDVGIWPVYHGDLITVDEFYQQAFPMSVKHLRHAKELVKDVNLDMNETLDDDK